MKKLFTLRVKMAFIFTVLFGVINVIISDPLSKEPKTRWEEIGIMAVIMVVMFFMFRYIFTDRTRYIIIHENGDIKEI